MFQPSEKDISTFESDGVVCLRNVLATADVAELTEALDTLGNNLERSATGYDVTAFRQQIEARQDTTAGANAVQYDISALGALVQNSGKELLVDDSESGLQGGHFLLDTSTWLRNKTIRSLALDSNLPRIAANLMAANKINFCDDQIFLKQPGTLERTALHQDYSYFRFKGWQGCVMWICVDHADHQSGALSYLKGSHRWAQNFLPNPFVAQVALPGSEGESLEPIEAHPERYDFVQFEVEPGDIVVHHFRTVHGAGGNKSRKPRRALSLRYSGDDMRYHLRPGTADQPYHRHDLKEGDPIDSACFPVVWPKPFPSFSLANTCYGDDLKEGA